MKTRTTEFIEPYLAVNYKKRLHAKRAIYSYIEQYKKADIPLRYDIISIVMKGTIPHIEHFENVEIE